MPSANTCPKCGADLPADALQGHCPACMVRFSWQETPEDSPIAILRYFGDYELQEEIARGGMGVVYKARQASLNRTVAVKMILAGQLASEADVQRFRAEAQAAANLQHPNIVAIHEVSAYEGQHYFSMDYVEGKNLADLVRGGPLPVKRAAAYVKTIAEAIQYAHERGTLHRDLKPSNVLIDQFDQPQVTDFGLAKRLEVRQSSAAVDATGNQADEEESSAQPPDEKNSTRGLRGLAHSKTSRASNDDLTLSGQILGSPNFMPPEQAGGKRRKVGPHSDIYGLGAILYHLLTARPPFVADTVHATLRLVCEAEPISLHALNPTVPRDLETICFKCLEKDPGRRYASAQELTQELDRFLRDEPIRARPVGPAGRLGRWARRKPALAVLSAALIVAVVAGFAVVLWQLRRVARHAQAETQHRQRAEAMLAQMEIQMAENAFEEDNAPSALPYLARVLRRDPSNHVAAARLLSALTMRSWALPVSEPIQYDGPVGWVRFSPDETRLVTASDDSTARVWDAPTGRPLTPPMRHSDPVRYAEFSPDGLKVVTASGDATARIWNARTGQPLTAPLRHDKYVNMARFSPDGTLVASASDDRTARIWNAESAQPIGLPLRHEDQVYSAVFSSDGQQVLTGSSDGTARLWDARRGQPLGEPFRHGANLRFAEFSPDNLRIVTGGADNVAWVWDARTGQRLGNSLKHDQRLQYVEFSPEGLRVVTVAGNVARIWDARTGQPLSEPLLHAATANSAQFSADGQRAITSSFGGPVRIWEVRGGNLLPLRCEQGGKVLTVRFSGDGTRLVTASDDHSARVWDARTGQPLGQPLLHNGPVVAVEFSPDGSRVATASYDDTARIWEAATGRPLTLPLPHSGDVECVRFSPDGQKVVTGCGDDYAQLWDARTGEPLGEPMKHRHTVFSVEFSPDGLRVVTASSDYTARVWDGQTGRPLSELIHHGGSLNFVTSSPDGHWVLTACEDSMARIWDPARLQAPVRIFRHSGWVRFATFSPDGRLVATASTDKTARVWDVQSGQPVTEPLKHEDQVMRVRFSPDGRRVVTASWDKTARIWDAHSGALLSEPLRHGDKVNDAEFSPDGARVATASSDGTARIWEVPPVPVPVPDWLPDLAEALAGQLSLAPGFSPVNGVARGGPAALAASRTDKAVETASAVGSRRDTGLKPGANERSGPKERPAEAGTTNAAPNAAVPPASLVATLASIKERSADGPRPQQPRPVHAPGVSKSAELSEPLRTGTVRAPDFYARWAEWFFADRGTRAISPFSSDTFPDYVARCIEENTIASLEEVLRFSPTNPIALARLGAIRMSPYQTQNPQDIAAGDWLTTRAMSLAPDDAEPWRLRAEALSRLGRLDEALATIQLRLKRHTNEASSWHLRGWIRFQQQRWSEALPDLSRALALGSTHPEDVHLRRVALQRSRFPLDLKPQVTKEGGAVSFQLAKAAQPGWTYQWRMNGVPISDATNAALLLEHVTRADLGRYSALVRDATGETTTSASVPLSLAPFTRTITGQWDFDEGNLAATLGHDLEFYDGPDGQTAQATQFGTTTSFGLPDIAGQPARVMRFPAATPTMGYVLAHGAQPNGSGLRVNQFTLVMDLLWPAQVIPTNGSPRNVWAVLLQSDHLDNRRGGVLYINWKGHNGWIGSGSYEGVTNLVASRWHRVAVAVDLAGPVPIISKYIDGVKQADQGRWPASGGHSFPGGKDGHCALHPLALLFTDGRGNTLSGYVNSIQFHDAKLTDAQIRALGGPSAEGIPLALLPP